MPWYLIDGLNPEPWESPNASVGRKNGKYVPRLFKSEQLRAYQEALGEEFDRQYPDTQPVTTPCRLELYFWRQVNTHDDDGRMKVGGYADATNLQKATEDALQGRLYVNDRQVVQVTSVICGQGTGVAPHLLIGLRPPASIGEAINITVQHARKLQGSSFLEGPGGQRNVRKIDVDSIF